MRSWVVLQGLVVGRSTTDRAGRLTFEATLSDGTGEVRLAFLGRRCVAGIQPGRRLTVAGTIGSRRGRAVLMNPQYWLHPTVREATDA